jgi:hypothetical protein
MIYFSLIIFIIEKLNNYNLNFNSLRMTMLNYLTPFIKLYDLLLT